MKNLLLPILFLFLVSCGKDPKNDTPPEETTADTITTTVKPEKLYIKDPSQYSPEWIAGFKADSSQYESARIMGEYMLVDKDTAYFDTSLKLKQDYRFTAFTDTHFYQLTIKRINYTTLEYDFTLLEKEKPVYSRRGRAHLGAMFFLGSESSDDDETGESYLATEYYDKAPDGLTIDIGEPDEQGRIRANIQGLPAAIIKDASKVTLRQSL